MSDKRIIIRNCPALRGWVCNELFIKQGITVDCQDCTDCVIKRIVELRKKEKILYEGDYIKVKQRTLIPSDKILELLDVQEVK